MSHRQPSSADLLMDEIDDWYHQLVAAGANEEMLYDLVVQVVKLAIADGESGAFRRLAAMASQ